MPPALRLAALLLSITLSISYTVPSSHLTDNGVMLPSVSNLAITSTYTLRAIKPTPHFIIPKNQKYYSDKVDIIPIMRYNIKELIKWG